MPNVSEMPQKTFAITTLGCRLNQFDSDAIERMAKERGWTIAKPEEAAVHIVNGCTITHDADADSRQAVRRAHKRAPDARIVVTGCYANSAAPEAAQLAGVSAVIGNGEKHELFELFEGGDAGAPLIAVDDLRQKARNAALTPALAPRRARTYLKVQDGCDYKCSFCIVPRVRGKSVSIAVAALVEQLKAIVATGTPEIVLTGVHLGTYGRDLNPRVSLTELIAAFVPHLNTCRLRLGSLDPHEVTDDLVALMLEYPDKICRHLHLPVQSLDSDTLRAMRRAHSAEDFQSAVDKLRVLPDLCLGTDVITGFPAEDDAAFNRTLATLKAAPLAYMHVFSYSPRRQTEAENLGDPVSKAEKQRRTGALRELSQEKHRAFVASQQGAVRDAVVLRARDRQSGKLVALTDNYIRALCDGPNSLLGKGVRARVLGVNEYDAPFGELAGKN